MVIYYDVATWYTPTALPFGSSVTAAGAGATPMRCEHAALLTTADLTTRMIPQRRGPAPRALR